MGDVLFLLGLGLLAGLLLGVPITCHFLRGKAPEVTVPWGSQRIVIRRDQMRARLGVESMYPEGPDTAAPLKAHLRTARRLTIVAISAINVINQLGPDLAEFIGRGGELRAMLTQSGGGLLAGCGLGGESQPARGH